MQFYSSFLEHLKKINLIFRLAKDKSNTQQVSILLVEISANLYDWFIDNQHLAIAALSTCVSSNNYSVNLVSKHATLVLILSRLNGLNKASTISMLQTTIAQYLMCNEQLNVVAGGKILLPRQKLAYKHRHHETFSLLRDSLHKIPLLQLELIAKVKGQRSRSQDSHIICLTSRIAKALLGNNGHSKHTLRTALIKQYLKPKNQIDKLLIEQLGTLFSLPLPGEIVCTNDKNLLTIGHIDNTVMLTYDLDTQSYHQIKHFKMSKQLVQNTKAGAAYFALWEKLPTLKPVVVAPYSEQYFTRVDLQNIKKAADLSIGKVLNELDKNEHAESLVLTLAKRFSAQPINDIKHAIALVGIEQLPSLLENQQLLQRLKYLGLINWELLKKRITLFCQFIECYKIVDHRFPCQKVINHGLKYLAFSFKFNQHGVILPPNKVVPKAKITDLTTYANFHVPFKKNQSPSLTANPFFDITDTEFCIENATTIQIVSYLHVVLLNMVFLGLQKDELCEQSKRQLDFVAHKLNNLNLDNYLNKLLDFSPENSLF